MNFLIAGELTPPPTYNNDSDSDRLAVFFLFFSIALVSVLVLIGMGLFIDMIVKKRKASRKKNEEQHYLEKGNEPNDPTELEE